MPCTKGRTPHTPAPVRPAGPHLPLPKLEKRQRRAAGRLPVRCAHEAAGNDLRGGDGLVVVLGLRLVNAR